MKRFAILLIATLLPLSAAAQTITGNDPRQIATLIQNEGYKAVVGEDSYGYPKISGRMSRSNYSVYFFGCDSSKGCNSIQFSAGYNLNTPLTLDKVNAWNSTKRFAKVHLNSKGLPVIRMDVNTDYGVTADNLADTLDYWRLILEAFEDHIGW